MSIAILILISLLFNDFVFIASSHRYSQSSLRSFIIPQHQQIPSTFYTIRKVFTI
ncbi:uncharacterized protein ASCRUDRAFT_73535 [Ascoidea rubescens DSM 1968]|uniref:Uncharacterized protein n=1 Tax=Ascoidea rubescens DSM 1968 TaxID=1344418 RepID=A0A1D2VQ44_9ASCO|nr:hypothetical protein ASCRUDRAFT_73535 [Ascoidea rubescens DSM 1968]ODV63740.1 hypothetical protein ASCRUDRAFT_73535 [Ascoidea rubescens DSM 1968]